MNAEDLEISQSTPGYRFDTKAEPKTEITAAAPQPQMVDVEAAGFFNDLISDPDQPLVFVITSYSIHYTKLYEICAACARPNDDDQRPGCHADDLRGPGRRRLGPPGRVITSYSIHYTKLYDPHA